MLTIMNLYFALMELIIQAPYFGNGDKALKMVINLFPSPLNATSWFLITPAK